MARKNRQLTRAELWAMGATPGLMAHKVGPDGRARLEQLAPKGPGLGPATVVGEDAEGAA
jgi:hypothetical protein